MPKHDVIDFDVRFLKDCNVCWHVVQELAQYVSVSIFWFALVDFCGIYRLLTTASITGSNV